MITRLLIVMAPLLAVVFPLLIWTVLNQRLYDLLKTKGVDDPEVYKAATRCNNFVYICFVAFIIGLTITVIFI